jgi:hypothetical protein
LNCILSTITTSNAIIIFDALVFNPLLVVVVVADELLILPLQLSVLQQDTVTPGLLDPTLQIIVVVHDVKLVVVPKRTVSTVYNC